MSRKQIVLAIQLKDGEMPNIDDSVAQIPLVSKNQFARAALHHGVQYLLSMTPGDAAQAIENFNNLDPDVRFKKAE